MGSDMKTLQEQRKEMEFEQALLESTLRGKLLEGEVKADRDAWRETAYTFEEFYRNTEKDLEELRLAAERYFEFVHTGEVGMGWEYTGVHPQTELKDVLERLKP